jgi:putative ABC transport system permease protein
VLTMRLNIPPSRSGGGQHLADIFQQLSDRIRTVPGVQSTGVASHIPFSNKADETVTIESNVSQGESRTESVATRTVSTDYFQVMGIRLVEGERFTLHDKQGAPAVVIINQAMAHHFWSNEKAVGKRLKFGNSTSDAPWMTVKGVVADSVHGYQLNDSIGPEVYFPHAQMAYCCRRMNLVVRTSVDPASLIGSIKREIRSLYKDQPVYDISTMEELISNTVSARRFAMTLLGVFAVLAMALASVGVYGVISYFVAQRTHEFGVRIAMGARERDVLRLVITQGMKLVLIGVTAGLCASFALTRLMDSLLFGVSATDPLTFVTGALLLTLVALWACWVPARRATKIDPLVALRCE